MISSITLYKILLDLEKDYLISESYINSLRHSKLGYYILKLSTGRGRLDIIIDIKNKILLPLTIEEKGVRKEDRITTFFKKFKNARITKISQIGLERIFYIELVTRDKHVYRVYFELIGRGNIIITDKEDSIISILYEIQTKDRELKINQKYVLPSNIVPNISEIDPSKLAGKRKELFRKLPIDPVTIKHIVNNLKIGNELSVREAVILKRQLVDFIERIADSKEYSIVKHDSKFYILPYKPSEKVNVKIIFSTTDLFKLSENFLRKYYIEIILKRQDIEREKLEHDKNRITEEIEKLNKRYERYKDIIPRLYEKINEIDHIFTQVRKGENTENLKVDRKKKIVYLKLGDEIVPLKYNVNPYKAISNLYEELKRIKQGIKKLQEKLIEINRKIEERKDEQITVFTNRKRYLRKSWYEKYIWSISRSGYLIIGGKDARTNEIIVKKYLEKEDLLFHADIHGSPFVILKKGTLADTGDIYDSAVITGAYSKVWNTGISAINVYYVNKTQVSKKAPTGEYIKTGSFMIYGKRNFVKNIPVKLYVGVINLKGELKILVGSFKSVSRHSICNEIFEISPGDIGKRDIAKKIISYYTHKHILPEEYGDAFVNDLTNRIPGKGKIRSLVADTREQNDKL